MQIGIFNIDSKGQETLDSNWVKCLPQDRDFQNTEEIEKFGVSFKFLNKDSFFILTSVSFRVSVLPKASPTAKFPKHLYGELVQTKLGLRKLQESKHTQYLIECLKNDSIFNKRVALWGLGNIGSSERGIQYLNKLGVISMIIEIAEKSSTLSLRGTAFHALCILASTSSGRKELSKHGWICSQSNIALPAQSEKIFWLESDDTFEIFRKKCIEADKLLDSIPLNTEEQNILYNIISLGNFVRKGEAEIFLKSKRQTNPEAFQNVNLFYSVMSYLTIFSFKMGVRKVAHRLFDKIYTQQKKLTELDKI